jgi:hypothetical protein
LTLRWKKLFFKIEERSRGQMKKLEAAGKMRSEGSASGRQLMVADWVIGLFSRVEDRG